MSTPNRSRSAAESLPSSVAPTFTTAAGPTVGEFVQPPDLNPNAEERRDALPEPEPNRLVGKLRAMSILYVIGIHLFLAVVLAKSDFLPKLHAKLFPRPAGEISDHFRRMSHYHAWMDGHIPDGSVFFIGDSITQALCVSSVAPNAVNLGIGGDTTWGLLNRIPSHPSLQRASLIVIAMGVNDLARRDNDEIIRNFRSILALLPARIPIIISSVLPVDERFHPHWKHQNNERIRSLNRQLEQLAIEHPHVTFCDSHSDMLDQRGQLRADFHVGDGIHLSTQGYSTWIQHLKQAINAQQD